MITIRQYTSSDKPKWDEFATSAKNATFLHQRDYMDYHADRFADHSLMAYNDKGKLVAILPANRSGDTLYSHQGLTFGGWLTHTRHFNANMMLDIFAEMCIFLKGQGISRIVYKPIPHIYHRYPAEEDLYALFRNKAHIAVTNMSSAVCPGNRLFEFNRRAQRTVKRATEAGVTIQPSENYRAFWEILTDNLNQKYGVNPVHTLEEMELLHSRFPENIRLYLACIKEKPVAGAVIFESETVAHAQYSSANPEGSATGALGYLFSRLITDVYAEKQYFDFGTSNEENGLVLNSNLIEMKSGYGARGIAYSIYEMDI